MPFPRGTIIVQPPVGGISRRTAFQVQPPFSSYASVNYWPIDAKSGRVMTGTRPRLQLQTVPSETPPRVNMITPVNGSFTGQPFESLVIFCKDSLYWWNGSSYTAATGTKAGSVDQDRAIYASPFLSKVYIPIETGKPLVFDYDTGACETIVESVGTAPSDCRISAVWQGCLWLAGSVASGPHILYASRQGDPTDWDFTVGLDDIGGAFFTGGEREGLITGPVTALAPQTAETMLVSTLDGLMLMRGHPRQGGVFEPLSKQQSILGNGAWAKTPDNVLWFLSKQGLYKLDPTPNSVPTAVSREKIPRELVGLTYNYEDPTVCMCYDSMWDVIYITVRNNNQNQGWMFDPRTGGFHQLVMAGYPYVMYEHLPFQTDSASGVLFGKDTGIYRFDLFGDQEPELSSSLIVGPIRLTENPNEMGKITRIRTIFGRNTPSEDAEGTMVVCAGVDAQDAVSRLMNGEHQYETTIQTLRNANGVVYPSVSGSAFVIGLTQSAGEVAVEEWVIDVVPMGINPHVRTMQYNITGVPSANATTTDFDALSWEGYSQATPDNAPSTLADFTHWIDLSGLPASWWNVVGPSGGDIRATDGDNNPLPLDLIHFNKVNQTGFVAVKHSALTTAEPVRLWVGKSGMAQPQASETYGQYNAYDSNYYGFWPDGGGNDRTSRANHLTHTNSTAGDTTGPIGTLATDYDEANHSSNDSYAVKASPGITASPLSMVFVARQNNTTDTPGRTCGLGTGLTDNWRTVFQRTGTAARMSATVQNTSTGTATTSGVGLVTDWHHAAATYTSTTRRDAYIDGTTTASNTTSITDPDAGTFNFIVGRAESLTATTTFQGDVSLLQLHNVARSADWVNYQNQMLNQSTFWNGWSAFVTVNQGAGEDDLDIDACPLGEVPVTETGTWTGYVEATADPLPSNTEGITILPNYTYLIDMDSFPASFWSAVLSSGQDIRVTDTNNIFLPFDLIAFDKVGTTGLLAVRQYATTGTGPTFRVWAGNASAVAVGVCAPYGRYRTYDQNYRGFWPSGGGQDRTQYANDLSANGGVLAGDVTGPIGNTATSFNGTDQYYTCSNDKLPTDVNVGTGGLGLIVVAKVNSPDAFKVAAPMSMVRSDNGWYYGIQTAATPYPYTLVSSGPQITWKTSDNVTTVDAWHVINGGWFQYEAGGMAASLVVDSTVNYYASFETQFIPNITNLDTLYIGATHQSATAARMFFDGYIALASLHSVIRSSTWSRYLAMMLTQSTFWTTWTWTASSSSLPQP